ncbi:hypothetical protein [Alteromonas facilis]|nr:hypothetical protein [Alteromonas facilis]
MPPHATSTFELQSPPIVLPRLELENRRLAGIVENDGMTVFKRNVSE